MWISDPPEGAGIHTLLLQCFHNRVISSVFPRDELIPAVAARTGRKAGSRREKTTA